MPAPAFLANHELSAVNLRYQNLFRVGSDGVSVESVDLAAPSFAGPVTIGSASAFPTGKTHMVFPNLDANIAARWSIRQAWFDNGLARKDPMLFVGYNFNASEGRDDATEPAGGIQLESHDVAGDLVTPLFAAHLTYIHTDNTVIRPWSASIIKASGVSDLSFSNRFFIVTDQSNRTLLHAAYGSEANVGVGSVCNSNATLHVKSAFNPLLMEYASGAANNKLWDWSLGAGTLSLRAVNDAYGAAGTAIRIDRSGATISGVYVFAPLGISASGDAFWFRSAAKTLSLTSDGSGGTVDTTLRARFFDHVGTVNGAAAAAGTLSNAPAAGNPTFWLPIKVDGVTKHIPCW